MYNGPRAMASIEEQRNDAPFARLLGLRVLESSEGVGKAAMPVREDFLQQAGVVQGGLIVTLADHALYLATRSLLSPEEVSVTVELKINFIAPAKDGELIGRSKVISRGKTIVVGEVEVRNDRGTLIATGTGTSLVRRRR